MCTQHVKLGHAQRILRLEVPRGCVCACKHNTAGLGMFLGTYVSAFRNRRAQHSTDVATRVRIRETERVEGHTRVNHCDHCSARLLPVRARASNPTSHLPTAAYHSQEPTALPTTHDAPSPSPPPRGQHTHSASGRCWRVFHRCSLPRTLVCVCQRSLLS